MSLRKKKVEDALSKLFSSKTKSTAPQSPPAEPQSQAAQPEVAQESAKPSRRVKASGDQPRPLPEMPAALADNPSPDIRPSEEGQARPEEITSPVPQPEPLPPTNSVAAPVAQSIAAAPNHLETTAAQPIPIESSPLPPKPASGDGSRETAERELDLAREAASEEIVQLVIFTLAGESFGLPIDRVESIIKPQAITVVPHARPYVVGVTNLRGTVLPVIDLRRRFHLAATEESEDQRIVVVLFNEEKIGLQVDSVTQVLRLPLTAIEPPPPIVTAFVHSAFVTGIAKVDERLVILLDLEKVLLPGDGN